MAELAGVDFFTVEVLTWRGLATYLAPPDFVTITARCASRRALRWVRTPNSQG
jgi:hypothetical protein